MKGRVRGSAAAPAGAPGPAHDDLPEPYTGALADGRHLLLHRVIAVIAWLAAALLVAWFLSSAPSGAVRFLLIFLALAVAVSVLLTGVAVWLLRPSLIRDRSRPGELPQAPDRDALERPQLQAGDLGALGGEVSIETVSGRRRTVTAGRP